LEPILASRNKKTTPLQTKISGTKLTENNFSILAKETDREEPDPSKDAQEEGAKGNQNPEDKGNPIAEEEGEQNKSPQRMEGSQNIEEGEISTGSDS
jgi:hypothetical protein